MKKPVIITITLLLGTMGCLCAQDTIDTNYYRYDHHFFGANGGLDACPNGRGFDQMINNYDLFAHYSYNNYIALFQPNMNRCYMMYMFGKESVERTIYGIGICLDSIANFTKGDTLTVAVCRLSGDRTHMVVMDSISIKGGELGKRRWMKIPMRDFATDHDYEYLNYGTVFDNCIGETLYRQVLEIYFDTPVEAGDVPYIFFRARQSNQHGSKFLFSQCSALHLGMLCFSTNEFTHVTGYYSMWTFFFPILTPLPEWEEASMEQVIPWPAGVTPPPDNPHNPDNPDNPNNPDNPDTPDNPSGNEGIGMADTMPSVTIFPNPSDGLSTVSCPTPIAELSVFDMSGRIILHENPCNANASINTSSLRKGIYLVKVITAVGTKTSKLVVK